MDDTASPPSSTASSSELEELRQALCLKYPDATNILGAQLGLFIRRHLADPDLKRRFGGLKNFTAQHFPAEIRWKGKKGLDDLYDVRFASSVDGVLDAQWQKVAPGASPWLWAAVTNPSSDLQFAWDSEAQLLMRAAEGTPRSEGLIAVEKLSKDDYRSIARDFSASRRIDAATRYLKAIESSESSIEFTIMMREDGLLSEWEEFRVENAVRLFGERLAAAGANEGTVTKWTGLLQLSQQEARAQRHRKVAAVVPRPVGMGQTSHDHLLGRGPGTRAVASRAIEFLSEAELAELRLPLGSIMRALRSLIDRID